MFASRVQLLDLGESLTIFRILCYKFHAYNKQSTRHNRPIQPACLLWTQDKYDSSSQYFSGNFNLNAEVLVL